MLPLHQWCSNKVSEASLRWLSLLTADRQETSTYNIFSPFSLCSRALSRLFNIGTSIDKEKKRFHSLRISHIQMTNTSTPSPSSPSPSSPLSSRTCHSTTFPVPIFQPGEYPRKSQQAHSVLGVIILLMVLVWLAHVTQYRTPFKILSTAYKWSGVLQMLLGIYLLCWCFFFLKPTKLNDLAIYSTTDLLQIQHISISCSAICCGLSEFWYGTGRLKHQQWHVLWCINMVCIGMVFMVHPQPDFSGAATHTMLGMFIIIGAIFFLGEKWHQFPEDLYES